MSQDGGGRYYPFYKGPSAMSLFSLNEEEEEEEGDGDCMFGVDIIDTSSDLFSSRRERRERSTLFSEELNEKRSTSPLFPDEPLSSNQKRSLSSLFSDESSSSNQNENNDDHDIRFLPWLKSAPSWKRWVSVLLTLPTPSPVYLSPKVSKTQLPSSTQLIKDMSRETLYFSSSKSFLRLSSSVSSVKELDTFFLANTNMNKSSESTTKQLLCFWKYATSRTISGHDTLITVMSYLKRVTGSSDFVLRSIPDPKPTELTKTQVVTYNNFQVFKQSFHGDFSVPISPRLVVSCKTVNHFNSERYINMEFSSDSTPLLPAVQSSKPPCLPTPRTTTMSLPTMTNPSLVSKIMGSADLAYTYIKNQTRNQERKFFSNGFGDMSSFRRVRASLIREWRRDQFKSYFSSHPLVLEWDHKTGPPPGVSQAYHSSFLLDNSSDNSTTTRTCVVVKNTNVYDATFMSPLRLELPSNVQLGHIRLILPTTKPLRGLVVLTAATGEETYEGRERRFGIPLSKHGIGVLLLTVPYYGSRRPVGQVACYIRTVSEYMLQSLTVLLEGVSVLRWYRKTFPSIPLLVSGLSWGGGTAASIGIACRDLERFGCVPILGSTSPRAMVEGVLRLSVNWSALDENVDMAREKLERAFELLTLETFLDDKEENRIPYVCVLNALSDYYVTAKEGRQMYQTMKRASHRCDMKWIQGGHVTSFVRAARDFVPVILNAFDLISKQKGGG